MRRALLLLAFVLAGCGTNPQDPGDTKVLALATHEHDLAQRAQAAAHTHEPLALQEVLGEARLGQEDIEGTVPFGAPGREAAVVEAREVVRATTLLHSGAFALAQPHLDAAARAFSLVVSRARAG